MRRSLSFMSVTPEDMAFAALSAPVLLPSQYGGVEWQVSTKGKRPHTKLMPVIERVPPAYRNFCEEMRATPAGQQALHTYTKRLAFQGRSSMDDA